MIPAVTKNLLSILMGCFLLVPSGSALAQETPAADPSGNGSEVLISIGPKGGEDGSRFEAEVNAGESTELVAVLQNHGTEPIELRTFRAGLVPTVNGGLKMAEREAEPEGSALWIDYPAEEFTLGPGEAVERTLKISVPADTPPGQYVNAVALETVKPVNQTEGAAFEQYFRKVVSVYVLVPGDLVTDFSLGEPEVLVAQGRSGVQIPISNMGNVRIDLEGTLVVRDESGNAIHDGEVKLGPIYMGQSTMIQVPFAAVPPPGEYRITFSLKDTSSQIEKSVEDKAIMVPEDAQPLEVAPISFENMTVEPNADPIVFANVSVDVTVNTAYRSTRLTMSVYLDGELVEDFVLAENLSLSQGTTTVSQRYLPATDWESGTYSFSLKLESTESGQTSLLFEESDVATLEVP